MASKPFVSGWALIVIACCGNGPGWANFITAIIGVLIVWSCKEDERGGENG